MRFAIGVALCLLTLLIPSGYASAAVPQNIQQVANEGIKNFIPIISAEKSHYGLDDADNPQNITLREGYAYYGVSATALKAYEKDKTKVPNVATLFAEHRGYIFPMYVGLKPVGVMFVQSMNHLWEATGVSSYLSFENDFQEAQNLVTATKSKRLIYDPSVRLIGVAAEGGNDEGFVPMTKGTFYGFVRNQRISIKETADILLKINEPNDKNIDKNVVGGISNLTGPRSEVVYPWAWILIGLFLGSSVVFIGWRKIYRK